MSAQLPDSKGLAVFCAGGFRAALEKIAPLFAAETGRHVDVTFATPADLARSLLAGTSCDAAIAVSATLGELEKSGGIEPGSRGPIARTRLALVVRQGTRTGPVGTVDELRAFLRRVHSLALSDPKVGTPIATKLLAAAEKVRLARDIATRAHYVAGPGSKVAQAVAAGEADCGVTLASEISAAPGATSAGYLPDALQDIVTFDGFVPISAMNGADGRRFIDFIRSEGRDAIERLGMEAL